MRGLETVPYKIFILGERGFDFGSCKIPKATFNQSNNEKLNLTWFDFIPGPSQLALKDRELKELILEIQLEISLP